jgi:hypothetical protein
MLSQNFIKQTFYADGSWLRVFTLGSFSAMDKEVRQEVTVIYIIFMHQKDTLYFFHGINYISGKSVKLASGAIQNIMHFAKSKCRDTPR